MNYIFTDTMPHVFFGAADKLSYFVITTDFMEIGVEFVVKNELGEWWHGSANILP